MSTRFSRVELMEIRERAEREAGYAMSPMWKRAYASLADAADRLDAMMVRIGAPDPSDAETDPLMARLFPKETQEAAP